LKTVECSGDANTTGTFTMLPIAVPFACISIFGFVRYTAQTTAVVPLVEQQQQWLRLFRKELLEPMPLLFRLRKHKLPHLLYKLQRLRRCHIAAVSTAPPPTMQGSNVPCVDANSRAK
jgi:hypothetical protein